MDKNIKEYAINIRKNIIEMVTEAKSGHVGGSLSAVEILTYLYFKEMNIAEDNLFLYYLVYLQLYSFL